MVQEKVSWIPLRDKKKTAYLGVYLALALICNYVESLIPFYFGIPGVKLGLTNIIVVLMLYCVGTEGGTGSFCTAHCTFWFSVWKYVQYSI